MYRMLRFLTIAGLTSAATVAVAQDDANPPNLVGVWPCDETHALIRGEWTEGAARTLEVLEQRGATFTGLWTWSLDPEEGVQAEFRGEQTYGDATPLLGVIGWDNQTIFVVAHGDTHEQQYRLADDNTIEVVLTKGGDNAWVGRTVCRRQD